MTPEHEQRLRESIRSHDADFRQARQRGDWEAAAKTWLLFCYALDQAIREARVQRIEAETLAVELQVYRPTRDQEVPAPNLEGYAWVTTNKAWICAAVERRELVFIPGLANCGYQQEHYAPERKTVCGEKTLFPVRERFTSGGWPRLREVCPRCLKELARLRRWPPGPTQPTQGELFGGPPEEITPDAS